MPDPPGIAEPRTGLRMGDHAELMVKEWKISRREQDELALKSHQNYFRALDEGFQKNLMAPYGGLEIDNVPRRETTLEKLGKLKPAFDTSESGTLTAGNSSALTDGAAAVLLGTEGFAAAHGLKPLARFVDGEVAALDFLHEGLLMAPTYAVARLLERRGLKLPDFDYYEIHEAFAGQVLCTLKAWESDLYCREKLGLSGALGSIDPTKLNVTGGSTAVGHPFAATGARIVGATGELLARRSGRVLVSVCTAGGMGVAAIFESL